MVAVAPNGNVVAVAPNAEQMDIQRPEEDFQAPEPDEQLPFQQQIGAEEVAAGPQLQRGLQQQMPIQPNSIEVHH